MHYWLRGSIGQSVVFNILSSKSNYLEYFDANEMRNKFSTTPTVELAQVTIMRYGRDSDAIFVVIKKRRDPNKEQSICHVSS